MGSWPDRTPVLVERALQGQDPFRVLLLLSSLSVVLTEIQNHLRNYKSLPKHVFHHLKTSLKNLEEREASGHLDIFPERYECILEMRQLEERVSSSGSDPCSLPQGQPSHLCQHHWYMLFYHGWPMSVSPRDNLWLIYLNPKVTHPCFGGWACFKPNKIIFCIQINMPSYLRDDLFVTSKQTRPIKIPWWECGLLRSESGAQIIGNVSMVIYSVSVPVAPAPRVPCSLC